MIDFGLKKPGAEVPEREIEQLAQAWINEPAMQKIALAAAHDAHVPPGEPFNQLRAHLAYQCAQAYLRGRAVGRARIITLPEPPKPRPS